MPPLPTQPVAPPRVLTSGASLIALARPRLDLECHNPSDIASGPCTGFERGTLVTVRAGENLPAGTSVRFVRGSARADVAVAGLGRGKSKRFELPRDVCAGVGGGRLEVQIVRTAPGTGEQGQVVGTEGPFNLRC